MDREALLIELIAAACSAGDIIWDHFQAGCAHETKSDLSPVTVADRDGEAAILAVLARIAPEIPVIAEEEAAAGRMPEIGNAFFLVDPLDGTKEFIRGGDDFTVNIALVEHGIPTLGVVYAPARAQLWWGDSSAHAAFESHRSPHGQAGPTAPIAVRPAATPPCAVASKSHNTPPTEAWLDATGVEDRVSVGSSLKFLLIARGDADVYPRAGPTMEWDTAAGDAILRAAGGRVLDFDGEMLRYGKPKFFNPGFVATGPYEPLPLRPFVNDSHDGPSPDPS